MAARSPSPNPTRPTSSHPKTPESSNSVRWSGSFNKPSIDAEAPQRNSGSKAGRDLQPCLRTSFEQKENERDLNCSKTPRAVSSSKGVKNFMSPTISASSKAIAASPRKRILAERNEVISISDSLEFPARGEVGPKSEMGSGAQIVPGAAKLSRVSSEGAGMEEMGSKSEMGSGFRNILGSTELRKADPEINNHKCVAIPSSTPSPVIPPLDADPSPLLYDPKTNYLSPRPQFLHYKPNPLFEQYRNKEGGFLDIGDGNKLEDSFSSGSTEESQSSHLQQEPEEESSLAKEDTDGIYVSEPELISKPNGNHVKSRSFTRPKVVPLLLVVVIACLYAPLSDSPVISSSASSSMLENLNGLANRFRDWSITSLSKEELGSCDLVNLTFSALDQTLDFDFIFRATNLNPPHLETETEQTMKENMAEGESCLHETESKTAVEVSEALDVVKDVLPSSHEALNEVDYEVEKNVMERKIEAEALHVEEEEIKKNYRNSHDLMFGPKIVENQGTQIQPAGSGDSLLDFCDEYQIHDGLESPGLSDNGLEDKLSMQTVLGISVAVVVVMLAAAMVFLYMMRKRASVVGHEGLPPKKVASVSSSSESYSHAKGSPRLNVPVGVGESGPSEMSSSLHTSPSFSQQRTKRGKEGETLSNERRLRRDSAVSSSISYGSFTTYEKLSAKKGCRDEDAVTPVRRSSRIRNHVTSP